MLCKHLSMLSVHTWGEKIFTPHHTPQKNSGALAPCFNQTTQTFLGDLEGRWGMHMCLSQRYFQ